MWSIDAETRVCASLAYPNRKTNAPAMHNAGFEFLNLNFRYVAFEPTDIGEAMRGVRSLGLTGVSVSKPYKERVLQHLDSLDDVAREIGAVNVVHNVDGRLIGYNSDWIGASDALAEVVSIKGRSVGLFGAGGAARALAFGFRRRGAQVTIYSRTEASGSELAASAGAVWGGPIINAKNGNHSILVNATPVGRGTTELLLDVSGMKTLDVLMDINVQPSPSPLMHSAARAGATTIGGVRMLVLQGAFAFKLFTGVDAPTEVMMEAVESALVG